MLLDRHEEQALGTCGIVPPRAPRLEEIDAEAETGLKNRKHARAGPPPRQIIAAEENVPRLPRARLGAVIDVAIERRIRRGGLVHLDERRFDTHGAMVS